MFNVGGFAVYPGHGVGVIEAIENIDVGGMIQDFYVIRILDTQMTVKVPTADSEGMREVIHPDRIPEVLQILTNGTDLPDNHQPWNQRYRSYMERINSGSIFEVARVLRELSCLRCEKGLSFGEKKLMDTAQKLIVKELAVSQEEEEAEVREELNHMLNQQ